MYEEYLALNNLQLICHKTKPNQINIFSSLQILYFVLTTNLLLPLLGILKKNCNIYIYILYICVCVCVCVCVCIYIYIYIKK